MDERESQLLQETHDSTIRQEGKIDQIHSRLTAGDQKLGDHERRILALEAFTGPINHGAKWARRVAGAMLLAVSYPLGVTVWEKLAAWWAKKGP